LDSAFKTECGKLNHWLTAGSDKGVHRGNLVDADHMFSADPFTCTPRFNPLFWLGTHISRSPRSSRQMQGSFPALV
jgi:hypothetical protein